MRLLLPLIMFLGGCIAQPIISPPLLLQGKVLLQADTRWQGEVIVDGEVTVAHGVTLRIAPGSNIRFVRRDADRDGLGDATIIVKGRLLAAGTETQPIRFLSAEKSPQAGDWLEIRSDFAQQLAFDWCEFRDSAYTLHAHFTRGHMRNSHIHHNIDGCRLGRSKFLFQNNLVELNAGKGINFRDSEVTLVDNIIRNNRTGIFLFERPGQSVIRGNNLYGNELNLQLGDFFSEDVSLAGNWWGSADPDSIARSIHDRQDDPEIGQVSLSPAKDWLYTAGIQHAAEFKPLWQVPTSGFVDSTPVEASGNIYFASWDGRLRAIDPEQGELLWTADTGDVIDGDLLAAEGQIFLQNWSRQFFAVAQTDGKLRKIFEYPPSSADDHRQAGIAMTDRFLLLPAWNGNLYAFKRNDLELHWQHDSGMPLRSAPLVVDETIYQTSGSSLLSALSMDGQTLWKSVFEAALLSSVVSDSKHLSLLDKSGTLSQLSFAGELRWQNKLDQISFYSTPVIHEDSIIVVTAAGYLWKIDKKTGETIWSRSLGAASYATPTICDAGILVGDNQGRLSLVDFYSGRLMAIHKTAGAIQSQVLVTGNRLYLGSRDQKLHALELVRGEGIISE